MRTLLFTLASTLTLTTACSPGAQETAASGANPSCFGRSSEMVGGPIQLTASDGKVMTEKDFAGRKALVFFGYTYCPDICPITLFNLGKAMADVPKDKQPMTVFISVDPERDTSATIEQYIRNNGFPQDIVGLTGTTDQLKAATSAFKTTFGRDDAADSSAGYLVSHSSILYLMDENWKLETFFMQDESPAAIASCLSALS